VTEMALTGDQATEWELYRQALDSPGILLTSTEDELRWEGGDGKGFPTAKKLYKALADVLWAPVIQDWTFKLWSWQLALKVKLFFWLLLKNKLLTWDVLSGRGWEGLSFYILCRNNQETSQHLFITCPFTHKIWTHLEGMLKTKLTWEGQSVDEYLSLFDEQHHSSINLPAVVFWCTWLERNNLLFDYGSTFPLVVASKVMWFYNAQKKL
jgi:hypothetical protein